MELREKNSPLAGEDGVRQAKMWLPRIMLRCDSPGGPAQPLGQMPPGPGLLLSREARRNVGAKTPATVITTIRGAPITAPTPRPWHDGPVWCRYRPVSASAATILRHAERAPVGSRLLRVLWRAVRGARGLVGPRGGAHLGAQDAKPPLLRASTPT